MRRGSISLGDVQCDKCHRMIKHAERFLAVEEEKGVESEAGKTMRYCMQCAEKKGYATRRQDKDEEILTIFPTTTN